MNRLTLSMVLIAMIALGVIGALKLSERPIEIGNLRADKLDAVDGQVSFSIVVTATASAPEGAIVEGGNWFRSRILAHSAILVCHKDGFIVFDTGLGRDIADQTHAFDPVTRALMSYDMKTPLADVPGLNEFCPGRDPQIVLSHLHWDHAGGIEDFPEADIWTLPEERFEALEKGVDAGVLPGQIDSSTIKWRTLPLPGNYVAHYRNSNDFFMDGSVIFVPMNGHTPGSIGMFLNAGGVRYFFTGDTTWALEGFMKPAHKSAPMRNMVDHDHAALGEELALVHALMMANPDLIVVPAHDFQNYPEGALYPDRIGVAD